MSLGECVYSCRHPLWGGEGTCITGDDSSVDDRCECDDGFVTRDSFGSPSCVSKQVMSRYIHIVCVHSSTVIPGTKQCTRYKLPTPRKKGSEHASM